MVGKPFLVVNPVQIKVLKSKDIPRAKYDREGCVNAQAFSFFIISHPIQSRNGPLLEGGFLEVLLYTD